MTVIDSHLHFWKYNAANYGWIDDTMQFLKRDFLPEHIQPEYRINNVSGCIAVEAHQTNDETTSLLTYASEHLFIKGVVGFVNLTAENIDDQLHALSNHKKLKGFRMDLQCEEPAFMLQPAFLKGISLLEKYGFTYDLVILPKHLGAALRLAEMFPAQRFVINHLAKPCIKDKKTDGWKQGIEALANHPNVYCKISGMVTEADWENWSVEDLKPYLDIVTGCFGISRLMYGGDWPVCLLATSYYRWLNTVVHYFNDLTAVDKEKFFSKNAIGFYNL